MSKLKDLERFLLDNIGKIDNIHKSLLINEIMENEKLEHSKFIAEAIKRANIPKKFEYRTITENESNFDYLCNEILNQGWIMNGGVSIAFNTINGGMVYAQGFYREVLS